MQIKKYCPIHWNINKFIGLKITKMRVLHHEICMHTFLDCIISYYLTKKSFH